MMERSKLVFVSVTMFLLIAAMPTMISGENEEWKISFYYMEDNGVFKFISTINGTNYTWNFGNGDIAYGKEVEYPHSGVYEVTLIVIKEGGGIIQESQMIDTGNGKPVANFTYFPEYPYTLDPVFFSANRSYDSDGYIVNWTWDFGDGSHAYGKNVIHTYQKAGEYNVKLTVVDNDLEADSVVKVVNVRNRLPVAKFYWTRLPDDELEFQANFHYDPSYDEDGNIVNYTWSMGDGNIKYGPVIHHSYSKNGLYNVTLTVTDDNNGSSSFLRKIHSNNGIPSVNFTWKPKEPTDLDNVTFISKSKDDGEIVNYTWEFGDGTISHNQSPVHRYTDNGYYTVGLTVIDNEGAFNYSQAAIYIKNVPPVANFTYTPPYPVPGRKIIFNASSSYDLDGNIVSWTWDFGDGNTSSGVVVNHSYAEDGVYTINLTVKDNDGATAIVQKTILLADLYVDENVYDPANRTWNKIQDAVDNATNGAFIYVKPGTYEGDVYINKSVMIVAEKAKVEGVKYGFYLDAPAIIMLNFSINGGENGVIINSSGNVVENLAIKVSKDGIVLKGNGNIIRNVLSNSNNVSLLIYSSSNSIENGIFHGNLYGISIYGEGNTIMNSTIYGGIYGISVSSPNNIIHENRVEESTYGIYLHQPSQVYDNNIISCSWGIKINSPSAVIIGYNKVTNSSNAGIEGVTQFMINGGYFMNNTIAISSLSNAEMDNISITGGGTGIKIYGGTITNSTINGAGCGIEGNADIAYTSITNCSTGVKGSFTIFNCILKYNGVAVNGTSCRVNETQFSGNDCGVKGGNSTVINSIFESNGVAILLLNNNTLYANQFTNNGIAVDVDGEENNITSNNIYGNLYAINVGGFYNNIGKNNVSNNTYGIRILFSPHNILRQNIMENNTYNFDVEGDKLQDFFLDVDESNIINGKVIKYIINQSDFGLNTSYGYVALINCSNVSIQNLNISHNGEGLLLVCSSNITISSSVFSRNIKGLYSLKGNGIEIEDVDVSDNNDGISLKTTTNVFMENITGSKNSRGINFFFMERMPSYSHIKNVFMNENILAVNMENIEEVSMYNITLENNEMGIRIFNSNISISSINMDDDTGIYSANSYLQLKNFKIAGITSMNSVGSTVIMENGSIENSSDGIISNSSTIKLIKINMWNNVNGINSTESTLYVEKCNFSGNKNNIASSCHIFMNSSYFSYNDVALSLMKGEAEILLSEFYSNGNGVWAEEAKISIINSTFHENENGVIINSSLSVIYNGKYFNNTVAIKINGSHNIINGTPLHHNKYAVILYGENNTVANNSIWKNLYGLLSYGEKNVIYHNNFISNTENARDYGNNMWNVSYPIGGNYWDDYAGEDYLSGKGQNESGSDGIGDIPQHFYGNVDYYPLMDYFQNASSMPNKLPVASFYFYPSSPFSLQNILFIDTSYDENGKRDIVKWQWDFGDGNTSNERNPVHAYKKSGVYNVTLKVEDRSGGNSTFIKEVVVKNLPPVATFKYTPENPHSFILIELNASGSKDDDGYIVNYTWDMGDGTIKHGSFITHKYSRPGHYTVKLTVIDNEGNESVFEETIIVDNRPPEANFIVNPESPKVGEEINFTDLSSDLDGNVVEWRWDFGDGNIAYTEDASHSYDKAGEYKVTLYVKDDKGAKSNYTLTINVKEKEMPGFEILVLLIAMMVAVFMRLKKFK